MDIPVVVLGRSIFGLGFLYQHASSMQALRVFQEFIEKINDDNFIARGEDNVCAIYLFVSFFFSRPMCWIYFSPRSKTQLEPCTDWPWSMKIVGAHRIRQLWRSRAPMWNINWMSALCFAKFWRFSVSKIQLCLLWWFYIHIYMYTFILYIFIYYTWENYSDQTAEVTPKSGLVRESPQIMSLIPV